MFIFCLMLKNTSSTFTLHVLLIYPLVIAHSIYFPPPNSAHLWMSLIWTISIVFDLVYLHPLSEPSNPISTKKVEWFFQCRLYHLSSVQFSAVAQSCPTLCDPMNHSTSGLPVHHQLPEFTQTHIHRVSDAIQPSHPLSSPFPPAPNPSWR